jgi:hypothetical protein
MRVTPQARHNKLLTIWQRICLLLSVLTKVWHLCVLADILMMVKFVRLWILIQLIFVMIRV